MKAEKNSEIICECSKFEPIELCRESIDKRIKKSKRLKESLVSIVGYREAYRIAELLRCPVCSQLWQKSSAWNFGAKEYLFKVPEISIEDWISDPYMQPDEMMICAATNAELLSQSFEERDVLCREENCKNFAIRYHILCKKHYLKSRLRMPAGRLFPPYEIVNG